MGRRRYAQITGKTKRGALLADQGYDTDALLGMARAKGMEPVIPPVQMEGGCPLPSRRAVRAPSIMQSI